MPTAPPARRAAPALRPAAALALALLLALAPGAAAQTARPPARAVSAPAATNGAAPLAAVRDSLAVYYARQDVAAVARLDRRAQTREDRLLVRYRLFPLTQDRAVLREIPPDAGVTSARELALIAALWAYRASSGPRTRLPIDGTRSERILGRALARDPDEPYALLVRGQSLLYKPRAFGGNPAEAQRTFERLRTVLARRPAPGIHPFEPEVWIWMSVRRQNAAAGEALGARLLARRPPPLFRQFLLSPP